MTFNRDMFGTAELTYSSSKHLGNQFSRLSQIQDGRWKVVSDYVAFSGRAPRSEFWFWYLFVFILLIVGGILDVIDSILFAAPVAYWWLT